MIEPSEKGSLAPDHLPRGSRWGSSSGMKGGGCAGDRGGRAMTASRFWQVGRVNSLNARSRREFSCMS